MRRLLAAFLLIGPHAALRAEALTRAQFDETLDRVEAIYAPIVAALGKRLLVTRKWEEGYVAGYAYPERPDGTWQIALPGGYPSQPSATQDDFAALICHELGHYLGGAPRYTAWHGLSSEGQADYFATLKCLRRVFADPRAAAFTRPPVDPVAEAECARAFPSPGDRALCARGATAGFATERLLADFFSPGLDIRLNAPDPTIVDETLESPAPRQCRADTALQGALCTVSVDEDTRADDPSAGACTAARGHTVGMRPRCWYKPTAAEEARR
ncbi:MAG: hypothetical protein HY059_09310 [Proteobacteria bacterium]|nr:hypothetical protein [Pseudomonadota bacterium]